MFGKQVRSQLQFIDLFDGSSAAYTKQVAMQSAAQSFTYEDVRIWSFRMAHLIRELSNSRVKSTTKANALTRHTRITVVGMVDPMGWACVLAAARAGAIYVPINVNDSPNTIVNFLNIAGCDIVFFSERYQWLAEIICSMVLSNPRLVSLFQQYSNLASFDISTTFPRVSISLDSVARIAPTGGTTGAPKAVMMTHQALISMTLAMCSVFDFSDCPTYLAPLPLTHATATFVMAVLINGGRIIQMEKPDPAEILAAIEHHAITHLYAPPTLLYRLLDHSDAQRYSYSSLKHLFYGAAPTAVTRINSARKLFGPVLSQFYGQVEAPQVVTLKTPREHDENPEARLHSCGRPSPVAMVSILDEMGQNLPHGESGEICIRGPLVMKGYLDNPEATEEALKGGYLHTGDVGYFDEAGYLYIVDRLKDMIISGGFNVYCSEVEAALMEHPAVRSCAVFGVPSAIWGEAVKAYVVLQKKDMANAEILIGYCKAKLGSIKTPKTIDFMEELPLTTVGKVDKRALRESYWKDTKRKI